MTFKCHAPKLGSTEKGRIDFSDGTSEVIPPESEADKLRILAKCAMIKKPICPKCAERMTPRMRQSGQVYYWCSECNTRSMIRSRLEKLSDAELEDALESAHVSYQRRLTVISQIVLARETRHAE